ncbi:MAG: PKD domain-containing protein, partial [Thermoplasmata archaeon]|nr:PKD domain-containing protein [Thermoplasmata archaeon]
LMSVGFFCFSSFAQDISDEHQVTSSYDDEFSPRIGADSDGNFHMVYLEDDGYAEQLMYRKIDPLGDTLVGPLPIDADEVWSTYAGFAIDVDGNDRVHIVYSVMSSSTDEGRSINYCRLDIDGNFQIYWDRVYSSNMESIEPDVAGDRDSHAHIVWVEERDPSVIMRMEYGPNGPISESEDFAGGSGALGVGGEVRSPKVGATSDNIVIVVWLQKTTRLSRAAVYYDHHHPVDDEDYNAGVLDSDLFYDASGLEGEMDFNDRLQITYVLGNEVCQRYVYVEPDGVGRGYGGETIFSTQRGEVGNTDVAPDALGNLVYTYMTREDRIDAPWEIRIQIWLNQDDDWTRSILVMEDVDPSHVPSIAAHTPQAGIVYSDGSDIYIRTITTSDNTPPVPILLHSPTQVNINEEVTFDGSGSTDPDEDDHVAEFHFDFGDGMDSGWTTSDTVKHSYDQAGTFTASLRVRDNHGMESTTASDVTVTVSSEPSKFQPLAKLLAIPNTADIGEEIVFNGGTSVDPDGSVA